jgi:hypothetical protein
MSITTAQQADALFKASLGVANPKPLNQFFEQPIKSSPVVLPSQIWADEALIPNTAPTLGNLENNGVVKKYVDLDLLLVSGSTQAYYHPNLSNVIPFNYGDGTSYNYTVKGSDGSPIPFGTNDWVLQNNVLTFYAGIGGLTLPPKLTFFQYIGTIGLPAGGGGGASGFHHIQSVSSNLWTIVHGLNCYPNVTVMDNSIQKEQVFGDVKYIDLNTITIGFGGAMIGEAYLV